MPSGAENAIRLIFRRTCETPEIRGKEDATYVEDVLGALEENRKSVSLS